MSNKSIKPDRFAVDSMLLTVDGKQKNYYRCTICGQWHTTEGGYRVDSHFRYWGCLRTTVKLCPKCSRLVRPIFEDLWLQLKLIKENAPKPVNNKIQKLCEAKINEPWDDYEIVADDEWEEK